MFSFALSLLLASQACYFAAATDALVRKAGQEGHMVVSVSAHGDLDTIEETPPNEGESAELMDTTVNDLVSEVEDMVASGAAPTSDKIKIIKDIVTGELLPDLKKTRDASETQVGVNLESIKTCNSNSQEAQKKIKSTTEVSVGTARTSHSSCRADEKTKEGIKDSKCGELDSFLNAVKIPATMPAGKPRPQMVEYVQTMSTYFCPKGPTVTQLDTACKAAEGEHAKQQAECNRKQAEFEMGFCTWRTQLTDTCTDLDTCYDSSVKAYNGFVEATKKLVKKWKVEYAALKKIVCYADVWLNDQNSKTVDSAQLSKCQSTTVDTSPMDIHYPAVPAKTACELMPVQNYPGTTAFARIEYASFAKYANTPIPCLSADGVVTVGPILPATPPPPTGPCSAPEASSYQEVRTVNIPDGLGNWDKDHQVPYILQKDIPSKISRVAYCLKLNDDWVWTSFDLTDPKKVGVPVDYVLDGNMQHVNVVSGCKEVQSHTNVQGKLEFWSHCYGRGAGHKYDHNDVKTRSDCYGSMQVHVNAKTVWAFNGWSHKGYCDVQIGHHVNRYRSTDGTFNRNCQMFANGKGTLHIYVKP